MRRRLRATTVVAVTALAASSGAATGQDPQDGSEPSPTSVQILRSSVTPQHLAVVTGETVGWRNVSIRTHTVTSETFGSDHISPGRGYSHKFDAPGTFAYHCAIHPFITGTVAVGPIVLSGPGRVLLKGDAIDLKGRVVPGIAEVTIMEDTGSGFAAIATVPVGADRAFRTTLKADRAATYRAVSGDATSQPVSVSVAARRQVLVARSVHHGTATLRATVTPAQPGGIVVLQRFLRERFGWWPVARRRLDSRSSAHFTLEGRAPVRVLLTLPDGATQLAVSRIVRSPRR